MGDSGSKMRQIYLVLCCASCVAMQVFWLLMGHPVMFWMFNAIIVCVLIAEVVNVIRKKMTVSTQTTNTIKQGGIQRIYGYCAILFMCLSIFFLGLHFGWL